MCSVFKTDVAKMLREMLVGCIDRTLKGLGHTRIGVWKLKTPTRRTPSPKVHGFIDRCTIEPFADCRRDVPVADAGERELANT